MNPVATSRRTAPAAAPASSPEVHAARPRAGASVLAWPAWLRLLAVLPVVALLWLAVAWAQLDAAPW